MAEKEKTEENEKNKEIYKPEKIKLNYFVVAFIIIFQAVSVLAIQRYIVFKNLKFSVESAKEINIEENGDRYNQEKKPKTIGTIFELKDEIIINPKDTYAIRFLATAIAFELSGKIKQKEMELWEPVIRDKIITLLMSKKMDFYTNPDNRILLKQEVKELVEDLVGKDKIKDVYFPKFVLQ